MTLDKPKIQISKDFVIALKDLPKLAEARKPDEIKKGFYIYYGNRPPEAA